MHGCSGRDRHGRHRIRTGGDSRIDHVALPDGSHLTVGGEVSDKGAAAALMMPLTHAMIRGLATRADAVPALSDLAATIVILHEGLSQENDSCMFVTMLMGAMLRREADKLALDRVNSDMRVAWLVIGGNGTAYALRHGVLFAETRHATVDKISDFVEAAATIIQRDFRVSTNVRRGNGARATGTRLNVPDVRAAIFGAKQPYLPCAKGWRRRRPLPLVPASSCMLPNSLILLPI